MKSFIDAAERRKFKPAFTQNNVDQKPDAPSLLGRCLRHFIYFTTFSRTESSCGRSQVYKKHFVLLSDKCSSLLLLLKIRHHKYKLRELKSTHARLHYSWLHVGAFYCCRKSWWNVSLTEEELDDLIVSSVSWETSSQWSAVIDLLPLKIFICLQEFRELTNHGVF